MAGMLSGALGLVTPVLGRDRGGVIRLISRPLS